MTEPPPKPLHDDSRAVSELSNDAALDRIDVLLGGFNVFEAMDMVRRETKHSAFLAYLLDASQPHGLADKFLRGFLERALGEACIHDIPLSETLVLREWRCIDVLLLNEAACTAVIIENKTNTGEHSDQLNRYYTAVRQHYPGWTVHGLFLSPEGLLPSDTRYRAVSFQCVADSASAALEEARPDVALALTHYVDMLRRYYLNTSELDDLCLETYRKHKRAIDAIIERLPRATQLQALFQELIAETPGLRDDGSGPIWTGFCPAAVDDLLPQGKRGWSLHGRPFMFWFGVKKNNGGIRLIGQVGPAPDPVREELLGIARLHQDIFQAPQNPGRQHAQVYSRDLITKREFDPLDLEVVEQRIRQGWQDFISHDLPRIEAAILTDWRGGDKS